MNTTDKRRLKIAKYSLLFSVLSALAFGLFLYIPMIISFVLTEWFSYEMSISDYFIRAVLIIIGISLVFTVGNFFYRLDKHSWNGLISWEKAVLYVAIAVAIVATVFTLYFKFK